MASKIADEVVQIRGGRGYETAASLAARGERGVPAEQLLRDMRINRIFVPPARRARAAAQAGGFYARWLPTLVTGEGRRPRAHGEFGPLAAYLRTDAADSALARRVVAGRYSWLEDGIIDPSIPGPWVAPAEPGPSGAENVHRHIG